MHSGTKWVLKGLSGVLAIPALSMAAFQYFTQANPPAKISQTGLYTNINTKVMDTAAKAFEVNSALWSDDAGKKRWVILRPGKKIQWVDSTDLFDYPDSTVFVKNFYMVMGPAPTDTVIWETRFLLFKKTTKENDRNWWGFSYRWNAAQNDANLVDTALGLDTAFTYVDFKGKQTYKKWKFPSQGACDQCHIGRTGTLDNGKLGIGRGVLGFMPMQLKKPITPVPPSTATDQVLRLFDQGVFSGTRPNAAALSKRFKGMKEPIDLSIVGQAKVDELEIRVRSYLAVNCSGCHGDRGGSVVTTGARIPPNFDYFDLKQHDMAWDSISTGSLTDTTSYTDFTTPPTGYAKLKWLVNAAGLGSYPYLNMAIPSGNLAEKSSAVFYKEGNIGYPAFSQAIFKQMSRRMPQADSAQWYQDLINAGEPKAKEMLTWMFKAPWGSKAWLDTLKSHNPNFTLDSVMAGYYRDYMLYSRDPDQMPFLATYLPDTTAMKVFAEWLHNGKPPVSIRSARGGHKGVATRGPVIQNRVLILPEAWTGKVQLIDMRGRATSLQAAGSNRYALPANLKPGLLIFKIGNKHFKAYLF